MIRLHCNYCNGRGTHRSWLFFTSPCYQCVGRGYTLIPDIKNPVVPPDMRPKSRPVLTGYTPSKREEPKREDGGSNLLTGIVIGSLLSGHSDPGLPTPSTPDFTPGGGEFGGGGATDSWSTDGSDNSGGGGTDGGSNNSDT